MNIGVVCIGEWLNECLPVVIVFCHIVSKSGYRCLAQSFGVAVCRRVVRSCREVPHTKKVA